MSKLEKTVATIVAVDLLIPGPVVLVVLGAVGYGAYRLWRGAR